MNSMARINTAISQCRTRDRMGKWGVMSLASRDLYGARHLLLPLAARGGGRLGGGTCEQDRIVRRCDAHREDQRIEVDVAAIALGLAHDPRNAERAGVDL